VKPRGVPKRLVVSQEAAVCIVPFFALALHPAGATRPATSGDPGTDEASSQEPQGELAYDVATYDIPPPITKGGRGARPKITMRVVCMTNPGPVAKGARIFVRERAPRSMEVVLVA